MGGASADIALQPMASYKVVLLGDADAGKSSLLFRLKFDAFDPFIKSTVGCEFLAIEEAAGAEGATVKLLIWDTAGQLVFRSFIPNFLRGANACVVCYDEADPASAHGVADWVDLVRAHCGEDVAVALVGTKTDLSDPSSADWLRGARRVGEVVRANATVKVRARTSSRTGEGVTELFRDLAVELAQRERWARGSAPPDRAACVDFAADAGRSEFPCRC